MGRLFGVVELDTPNGVREAAHVVLASLQNCHARAAPGLRILAGAEGALLGAPSGPSRQVDASRRCPRISRAAGWL